LYASTVPLKTLAAWDGKGQRGANSGFIGGLALTRDDAVKLMFPWVYELLLRQLHTINTRGCCRLMLVPSRPSQSSVPFARGRRRHSGRELNL
jgi:hypothetical protein